MSFESERIAQEKHDRIQRRVAKRFSSFDGRPSPQDIIEIVNRAIGEVDPDDGELTYEYDLEDIP
jgi:hypothetical protein